MGFKALETGFEVGHGEPGSCRSSKTHDVGLADYPIFYFIFLILIWYGCSHFHFFLHFS
jgi:hypothetical protein